MSQFYGDKNQARILKQIRGQVKKINSSIETKEAQWKSASNVSLPHNNITIVQSPSLGQDLNPFYITNGTQDFSQQNGGQRIGDKVSVKGLLIKAMFENALARPKVFYRVMLVKGARGDVPTRNTLFKNDSDNKMLDVVNTERYTIVAQKTFNIYNQGSWAASTVTSTGEPGNTNGQNVMGIGTKIIKMWIPGSKFGRYGNLQYENGNNGQLKFFDYRIVIVAYDWYGTPQDVNNVGKINELYTKVYYKDA